MGEDTSTLFGTTILALLKIAAERRSPLPEEERRPFYVYVDEFQNFATTPFVKMLSSSRKYKLFLTMAEQSTAQQEEQRLTEAILANVNTLICFSLGSPADERLLLGRFEPWLKKGDLLNQASYNFYMRVKAGKPMEPVSGETVVLPREQASAERADEVIAASRKKYATEYVAPPKTNDTIKKSSQTPPTRTKNKADPPKPKNSGVTKRAVGRRNSRNNRKKPK
jgi:type IV secretory pathway TraG/TraD family ATPase VirD4